MFQKLGQRTAAKSAVKFFSSLKFCQFSPRVKAHFYVFIFQIRGGKSQISTENYFAH